MSVRCLQDLDGVCVGHAEDVRALTGCTAVVFPRGAVAGHVAFGTATGTRELGAFTPRHLVERVHGICLCGGSAFGLAAASGVVRVLERRGIGHSTSAGVVPIVGGAVVYDLNIGDASVRPDGPMGAAAAEAALAPRGRLRSGNVGAGTGVTAGKLLGIASATKTGLGNAGLHSDEGLAVAALVVLNPVGDVVDPRSGELLAGARTGPDRLELAGSADIIRAGARCAPLHHNTTLAVVATNVRLSRVETCWVAEQALVALARTIDPPFTRHDGDVVFCASVGDRTFDVHRVGVLARDVLAAAVLDACLRARAAGGLPCARDLAT